MLNVNELAKSLRMAYLPGEVTTIELTQKGNDSHQGVGHLSDGTMVVVEHAYKQIGSKVEIEFIRGLQTAAGKMMFAKLVNPVEKQPSTKKATAKVVGRKAPVVSQAQPKPAKSELQPKKQQRPQGRVAAPTKSQEVRQATQQQPKAPARRPNNRRRSPEDSMVELANRSE